MHMICPNQLIKVLYVEIVVLLVDRLHFLFGLVAY